MKKFLLILLLAPALVLSQQIELFQQFNGRLDFTAFGNTLNTAENGAGAPCTILTQSSAPFSLLPGQTFVSAHLYWSGPGNGDFNVELNGTPVSATRTFSLVAGTGLEYFAAYADVSAIVGSGAANFTLSELDLTGAIAPYCLGGTNFGGWSVVVIYEDLSLTLNQISLFDGLEFVSANNQSLEIVLDNIDVATDELAKIGFLAWEGDAGIANNETLLIEGVLIDNPPLNPGNNAFNGTNSYTGSNVLYNMDLDVYDLMGIVMPGSTQITINLTSSQDFVMVNNLITSVNSEIPDATIEIDNLGVLCENRDLNVNYTVFNVNSTALLPANTPIAFYINNNLVGQSQTVADIPIDGSESGTITLNVPLGTPPIFDLKAVVDDIGDGTGIVAETNESNNEFILQVDLNEAMEFLGPDIQSCIGLTVTLDTGVEDPVFTFQWFFNGVLIAGENDSTLDVSVSGTYSVLVTEGVCVANDSVDVFFNLQPDANPAIDLYQCDANGDTGFFDLTLNDPFVLGAQNTADFNITYHTSQMDADSGANPIVPATAYQITTPPVEAIFARIEDLTGTCSDTDEFFIQFDSVTAGPMTDIGGLCDEDSNGTILLDLIALKNPEALNGQNPADFTVSYHPTQLDADNNTNPLANPHTVTASPETIFVRVENNDSPPGSCAATSSFEIEFFAAPVLAQPTVLVGCDELPNDGFAAFDLTSKDAEITGGNPEAVVVYYEDFNDAQNGVNPIVNPTMFINTTIFIQTIYARADNINSTDCFNIVSLDLQVNNSPPITDPITDLIVCDNDQDGVEPFDLTSKEDEIANTLVNLTFTYHTSLADATNGTPFIAAPMAYISGGEQIWVRAENIAGCFTVGTFNLVIDLVPVFVVVPELSRCDNNGDGVELFNLNNQNAVIIDGDPDLSVTYHPTEQDAMDATNFLAIPYTSGGEVIWVRVESNSRGCYGTFPMELIVVDRPGIFEPDPLVYCDDDNDGFGEFTLTDADDQVVNGNPAGNLVVSYHELLVDAQNNIGALSSPYTNIVPFNQTVYVRLSDIATGCYNITTLELLVEDTPQISEPDPLEECDDDGDGVVIFNLTDAEAQILAGLTGGPYVVNYFEDPALTIPIGNPTAYPNISNPQTIYVTVGDTNNICEAQTQLLLIVNLPPTLNEPAPYTLCDVNDPGDEVEVFDLTSRIGEITGGDPSVLVSFYESFADAQAGTNVIADPSSYSNIANPQDIYIRGESAAGGCEEVGEPNGLVLELRVENLPAVVDPTPLEECDLDNDGFAEFTLTDKDAEIANGDPSITVTYYETLTDAQAGVFALTSPYQNIVSGMQTVYARAIFSMAPNDNGCFKVVELDLIALPAPQLPLDIDPIIACEEGGTAVFDLTEREADILNGLDPLSFTVRYYEQQTDAVAGNNNNIAVPTAYTNIANPQTIYARVGDNNNLCAAVGQFQIEVREPPVAAQPVPFTKCDDLGEPNDGIAVFDLTQKNDEIAGPPMPGLNVSYHLTAMDAQDGTNAIDPATAYTNMSNPQTVYVRVEDLQGGCSALTTMTLRVVPNPVPVVPDAIEVCDNNEPRDGTEVFDLTIREGQIRNGATWQLGYYETYVDAVEGTDPILTPGNYTNTSSPQIIYVRVTNDTSVDMCFEIVELELIVNPLPDTGAEVTPLVICQVPNTGQALFDLTQKEGEILGGQDPSLFEVTYYESGADAQLAFDPIPNPATYANLTNPQDIYVGIENIGTGCYTFMQVFEIRVDDGAIANTPAEPYTICDNTDPNDGIADFTLEDADPASPAQLLRAEILAGNDPSGDFTLTYHETLAGAEAGTDPLGTIYTNIVNPQVIYARVENDAVDNGCFAVAEVILKVEQLPVLTLEEEYRLCVDAQGLPLESEFGGPSPPVLDTGLSPDDYSFIWELDGTVLVGEVGPSLLAVQPGVYMVTVTERVTGCMQTYATTVILSSPPTTFDVDVVTGAFAGAHTIESMADGLGEYQFSLDDGPFQDSGTFNNVSPGNHTVTIQDKNGCGSVVVEVGIVDYPRFVTPNQDGWNDTWNIIGIASADPSAKIYIFDRHGKLLKQISPLGEGWDGTYNGNPLPSSDYWFLVEYKEDEIQKEFRGHFTLKR